MMLSQCCVSLNNRGDPTFAGKALARHAGVPKANRLRTRGHSVGIYAQQGRTVRQCAASGCAVSGSRAIKLSTPDVALLMRL